MNKIVYIIIVAFLLSYCSGKKGEEQAADNGSIVSTESNRSNDDGPAAGAEKNKKTNAGEGKPGKAMPPSGKAKSSGAAALKESMTVEKYSNLNLEEAKLLMETYWLKFKGKNYPEVKNLFDKYKKEVNGILLRNGIKNKKELALWAQKNKKKIKQYWKEHPEYDVYNIYPEFESANAKIHELAQSAAAAKK